MSVKPHFNDEAALSRIIMLAMNMLENDVSILAQHPETSQYFPMKLKLEVGEYDADLKMVHTFGHCEKTGEEVLCILYNVVFLDTTPYLETKRAVRILSGGKSIEFELKGHYS